MNLFFIHSISAVFLATLLAGCAFDSSLSIKSETQVASEKIRNTEVLRRQIAPNLYEIVYSAEQDAVFVASSGGRDLTEQPSKILRLNPETLDVQAEIILKERGYGLTLDDGSGRLYVGAAGVLTVIDIKTNQLIDAIKLADKVKRINHDGKEVERFPHSFRGSVVDPVNQRLYTPGQWFDDSALYVVNTSSMKVERVLNGFGFLATGIALDADGNRLYVSNQQGQLFTVDTNTLAVSKTEVESDQMLNLTFDRKRQRILATDQGADRVEDLRGKLGGLTEYTKRSEGNRLVGFDANSGKLVTNLRTGEAPIAVQVDELRQRVYVTNRGAGMLTVFDGANDVLLQTVSLPQHPNSLALDPKRNAVFVTVKNSEAERGSTESVARIQF